MLSHPLFGAGAVFQRDLKDAVADYFAATGLPRRGLLRGYLKTAFMLAWLAGSYVLLVFVAATWWQAVLCASSLALAAAGVGFNVQHDGGHGGASPSRLVNRALASTLDLIGGSSYLWHWKHNILHHTYTNVAGQDDDINVGPIARLAPAQPRHPWHRLQHLYMWLLYGFVPFKWQLVDDFREVIRGKIGSHPIPRPRGAALATFLGGKVWFLGLAFVVPALFHPLWLVLLVYAATSAGLGLLLATTFQLAHCVPEAAYPQPDAANRVATEWAVAQVESTVDFAPRSRLLTWYLGGLNYQIEHHLFPKISHGHYPALAPIVQRVCRDHGVAYHVHASLRAALGSHQRWLRTLGRPLALGTGRL